MPSANSLEWLAVVRCQRCDFPFFGLPADQLCESCKPIWECKACKCSQILNDETLKYGMCTDCLPETDNEENSISPQKDSQETVIAETGSSFETPKALQGNKIGPSQDATSQQVSLSLLFNSPCGSRDKSTSNSNRKKKRPHSEDDSPSPTHDRCPGWLPEDQGIGGCGQGKRVHAQLCKECF